MSPPGWALLYGRTPVQPARLLTARPPLRAPRCLTTRHFPLTPARLARRVEQRPALLTRALSCVPLLTRARPLLLSNTSALRDFRASHRLSARTRECLPTRWAAVAIRLRDLMAALAACRPFGDPRRVTREESGAPVSCRRRCCTTAKRAVEICSRPAWTLWSLRGSGCLVPFKCSAQRTRRRAVVVCAPCGRPAWRNPARA